MIQNTTPADACVKRLAASIEAIGISPNEADRNGEEANVVDGLFAISRAIQRLASVVEDLKPKGEDAK